MNDLQNISFEQLSSIYSKYFTLNYLGSIALTCYITNELKKKGQKVTCYDVLLKVGKDFREGEKNTFLKSLGAICEDLMYGCTTFLDFGIKPKDMPKQLQILLDNYVPF